MKISAFAFLLPAMSVQLTAAKVVNGQTGPPLEARTVPAAPAGYSNPPGLPEDVVNIASSCILQATLKELLFWPTPAPTGAPAPSTLVSDNFTFTSPFPYLHFEDVLIQTLSSPFSTFSLGPLPGSSGPLTAAPSATPNPASYSTGHQTFVSDTILAANPSELSSYNYYTGSPGSPTGYWMQVTFSDLMSCPPKTGTCTGYEPVHTTRTVTAGNNEQIIVNDPCRAELSWPCEARKQWGDFQCQQSLGLLDPPRALTRYNGLKGLHPRATESPGDSTLRKLPRQQDGLPTPAAT